MLTPVPLDLETTGLDPVDDVILEFAMQLVTPDLEPIADFGSRVLDATDEQLDGMSEFVWNMHTETGLLSEIQASSLTIEEVDREAVAWLGQHGLAESRSGIILGASCRLDLDFIDRHMPLLAGLLHYKMIDISGMKEALTMWAPDIVPDLPWGVAEAEGWKAHRAASDVQWTLAEARALRSKLKNVDRPSSPAGQNGLAG